METGAEHAFLAAYDSYADALFRFCYAYTGSRERALDVVQESFTRTWKYLASGRRIKLMRPFLYRTARNVLIDYARRPTQDSLDVLREEGFDVRDPLALDPALSAEAGRVIKFASQLDARYRDAVLMRYMDGMPPRDIAAITGESENTISVRIHRGVEQLRALMIKKL